jgi:drug/metabolite transporter (DMT)-like permease
LHFLLFVSAVKDTTILHATVLVNTTPIFAMFFSILLYRARPSWASALGVLIAFTGMIALTLPETALGLLGNLRGDMEATIASLVEGLYLNLGKGVREKIPALVAMLPIYLAATALVMGATRVCGHSIAIPLDSSALLLLIGLGLLPTALGHTLYFSSLSGLKSYQTATMALLEPMIATALGLVLFAEAPNIQSLLGAAMILLGISLVIRE